MGRGRCNFIVTTQGRTDTINGGKENTQRHGLRELMAQSPRTARDEHHSKLEAGSSLPKAAILRALTVQMARGQKAHILRSRTQGEISAAMTV